jgi:hypothetical protein
VGYGSGKVPLDEVVREVIPESSRLFNPATGGNESESMAGQKGVSRSSRKRVIPLMRIFRTS